MSYMRRYLLALGLFALAGSMSEDVEGALIAGASVDGGGTVFAIDNSGVSTCGSPAIGPCQLPDADPTVGSLVINGFGLGGDILVQATVQTQDVATGPGTFNRLDTTGTQVTNNGAVSHNVQVVVSANNFVGPSVTASVTGAGQWSHLGGGFGDSEIEMTWWNDPANVLADLSFLGTPQPGNLLATFSDVAGPANPDSFSFNGGPFAVNDPGLFSMTLQFEGTIAPGVRLTGREQTEIKPLAVPLPSSFGLLMTGVGLVSASFLGRRRK